MMATTQQVQQQHVPLKMPKKRVTMIKHVVGKVKTTSYTLPEDPHFVYGIPNKMNEVGAGDILQSWAQSEATKPQASMLSFPLTNRKALQNGYLSAKSQREFAKKNPVMKEWNFKVSRLIRLTCVIFFIFQDFEPLNVSCTLKYN